MIARCQSWMGIWYQTTRRAVAVRSQSVPATMLGWNSQTVAYDAGAPHRPGEHRKGPPCELEHDGHLQRVERRLVCDPRLGREEALGPERAQQVRDEDDQEIQRKGPALAYAASRQHPDERDEEGQLDRVREGQVEGGHPSTGIFL
jgi:hypothetical protein